MSFRKQNYLIYILNKIYIYCLIVTIVGATVYSVVNRYYGFWIVILPTQIALDAIEVVVEMAFMISCFYSALRHRKRWQLVYRNICHMDNVIEMHGFRDSTSLWKCLCQFGFFHLMYCLVHVYELLNWLQKEADFTENGYILYRIISYYQLIYTLFYISITGVLKKRIIYLGEMLEDMLRKCVYDLGDDELLKVRDLFAMLDLIVANLNVIFGWSTFFNTVTNIVVILSNANYILQFTHTNDEQFKIGIILINGMYVVVYMLATMMIFMSSEGIERCGKENIKIFYLYKDRHPHMLKKLNIFVTYLKELAPSFTAAGFFTVNQSMLSTLFSAVIAYLIVIIQFNKAL